MLAEIIQIIDESPRVKRFILKPTNLRFIDFLPGQFVTLVCPSLPEFENTRSYSIASVVPGETIELCIALNPNGKFTPWLFQLKCGYQLQMSEPQGSFIYKDEFSEFSSVFICTGTGVAPFISMIYRALNLNCKRVYLVFGNRFYDDLLYRETFENWKIQYPQFDFIPVFSREIDALNLGYVHGFYEKILRDIGVDVRIFVCGWKDMCIQTRQNLKELGYNRRQYFFEQYD